MRTISCNAELTPDGQLILPPGVVKQLNVKRKARRRIIVFNEKESKKSQLLIFVRFDGINMMRKK